MSHYTVNHDLRGDIVTITITGEIEDGDSSSEGIKLEFHRAKGAVLVTGWFDEFENLLGGHCEIPISEILAIAQEMTS